MSKTSQTRNLSTQKHLMYSIELHSGHMLTDIFVFHSSVYILTLFCAATFMALLLWCVLCVSKKYISVLYAADR